MKAIDEIWLAEFRGLFWGEGCADIQCYHREGKALYRPRLRIQLRADDVEMLKEIHEVFGGTLNHIPNKDHRSKPAYQWCLQNKEEIVWVCGVLLQSKMKAKKLRQIEYVLEAAKLRAGKFGHMSDGEKKRIEELYITVKDLKRFE